LRALSGCLAVGPCRRYLLSITVPGSYGGEQ
jgi:hypothetical protein